MPGAFLGFVRHLYKVVHDSVRTIKMRCINNIKKMSEQPKEIYILNTRETTVSTKDSNNSLKEGTNNSVLKVYSILNTFYFFKIKLIISTTNFFQLTLKC